MKVYGAMCHREDLGEWINLVLTEQGRPVSCNSFDNEADCRFDMVEGSKIKLNQRYADYSEKYGIPLIKYDIIILDKNDPLFEHVRKLNDKHEARQANLMFRMLDKIKFQYIILKSKFCCMLARCLEAIEPYLDLH